jgi:outer membrane lipoprotein carrier protein
MGIFSAFLGKLRFSSFLAFLFWMSQAYCNEASTSLQTKLNAIRTMSAHFSQTVGSKNRALSRSAGTMALARPGRFRWQTIQPMAQLVVADGHHLWIYDTDLEQVTVKKQNSSLGGTAGLFLSGYNETVSSDFDVTMKKHDNTTIFYLRAKSNKAGFQQVKLMFDGDALTGIELFDQLGQHTEVHLRRIKTNPVLSDSLFQFKPPKGTDVVKQ